MCAVDPIRYTGAPVAAALTDSSRAALPARQCNVETLTIGCDEKALPASQEEKRAKL